MEKRFIFIVMLAMFLAIFAVPKFAVPVDASTANATSTIALASASTAKSQPLKYGVWLPFWNAQDGAQDVSLNLDKLNEVSPFSYEIGTGGKIVDDAKIDNGSWAGWFSAAHALNVKIIPTIAWFDTTPMYNLLSSAKTRQAQEDAIAKLAKTQKFDGIDIDYENKTYAMKPYYSLFIEGLSDRLHAQKETLTCTIMPRSPAVDIWGANPPTPLPYSEDYTVLNKYCDELRVMAYDQGTVDLTMDAEKGSSTLYSPIADPDWVSRVLANMLKSLDPKKVMLGIPTYGYEYQVSWKNGVTTYQEVRSFTYQEAMDRADLVGVTPIRDNADELSYTYQTSTYVSGIPAVLTAYVSSTKPQMLSPITTLPNNATNTMFVSFSDAQAALDKIDLAKKYGLRGVMFFKADGELDPATWDDIQ